MLLVLILRPIFSFSLSLSLSASQAATSAYLQNQLKPKSEN